MGPVPKSAAPHLLPANTAGSKFPLQLRQRFEPDCVHTEIARRRHVVGNVVGPQDEAWDGLGLVRYPSIEVFQQIIADPAYLEKAEPHRVAALAGWRLYATTSLF